MLQEEDNRKLWEARKLGQSASFTPNDPQFYRQWGLEQMTDIDIDATEAWAVYNSENTAGNTPVVVAVMDTGVDYTHGDIASAMWVNPGEIPGNSVDDDNNGWVGICGRELWADSGTAARVSQEIDPSNVLRSTAE